MLIYVHINCESFSKANFVQKYLSLIYTDDYRVYDFVHRDECELLKNTFLAQYVPPYSCWGHIPGTDVHPGGDKTI